MKRLFAITLTLVLLASPCFAAPPTFQAVGAINAATTSALGGFIFVTPVLPAHQANDVLLVLVLFRLAAGVYDSNGTRTDPDGWTIIADWNRGSANYILYGKRTASNAEPNPSIGSVNLLSSGQIDGYAVAINYRGCTMFGDPWVTVGTTATGTTDPATLNGINTATIDSLVVAAIAGEDDNNTTVTVTGTSPASYTVHYVESATGNDGMLAFAEGSKTATGATGNASVDFDVANPVGWGGVVIELASPQSINYYPRRVNRGGL